MHSGNFRLTVMKIGHEHTELFLTLKTRLAEAQELQFIVHKLFFNK